MSGDVIVVGAPLSYGSGPAPSLPNLQFSGAACTYSRTAGVWSTEAYLRASNRDEFDGFGQVVALDGDTAVVTAFGEAGSGEGVDPPDDDLTPSRGAVYVFR